MTYSVRRHTRTAVALTGAVAAVIGIAGCSASVSREDVATSVQTLVNQQVPGAGAVTCPADLKAEVGQTTRCGFSVDGQPVDAVATVTSIEGSTAHFDVKTEARPVAKALLERKLAEQVGKQTGVTIDSTNCAGDLPPQQGASVNCVLTGGGDSLTVKVTVTTVNGGLINYSFAPV